MRKGVKERGEKKRKQQINVHTRRYRNVQKEKETERQIPGRQSVYI